MFSESTKSTCCLLDFEPLKHKRRAFYVRMRAFNGNTVGASNLMAGNRELAWSYSPFKSNFVGALNTVLSYKKCSPWQKIERFLHRVLSCRFFSSWFSWPFKDFKESTPKNTVLNTSDFHWQSHAFVWFEVQSHGFTYQGRYAS